MYYGLDDIVKEIKETETLLSAAGPADRKELAKDAYDMLFTRMEDTVDFVADSHFDGLQEELDTLL